MSLRILGSCDGITDESGVREEKEKNVTRVKVERERDTHTHTQRERNRQIDRDSPTNEFSNPQTREILG